MQIHLLSEETIGRIAAGEVVERPLNVAKELIENSIDAGATAISCEIRDGGITLLRVTDNGCGIDPDEIDRAFQRHATSKIESADDLDALTSLGFRGEALASIAAVARVEMITKTQGRLYGIRASNRPLPAPDEIQPPLEKEEIGCPDGTTVIVRDLFWNVPVRKKFLRSAQTEAGYITDLVQKLALSHPRISFHYRVNGQEKLHTTGSGDLREIIYRIFGKEVSSRLLPVDTAEGGLTLRGMTGRPEISRSSRSQEIFFVNGRMVRSDLLSRALEEGYGTDLMQHRFPFAVLDLIVGPGEIDVNVHPSKMEVRFSDPQSVFDFISRSIKAALHKEEMILTATLDTAAEERRNRLAEEKEAAEKLRSEPRYEPFELHAADGDHQPMRTAAPAGAPEEPQDDNEAFSFFEDRRPPEEPVREQPAAQPQFVQETLFSEDGAQVPQRFLTPENAASFRIVGQVFLTYWIIEKDDQMLMIDQHAAHEKVNFERIMRRVHASDGTARPSQLLSPPMIIHLTGAEESAYLRYADAFTAMGFALEEFGQSAYAVRAVPVELFGSDPVALLHSSLAEIQEERLSGTPDIILSKIASMSCKAAVKGNRRLSEPEVRALIAELLALDDPYHCPHGRPTMILLSKQDIDRRFKRIVT